MQSRLLIINCPSEYFFYIPMGTFGLCDYLKQKNIPVKLLNLAVYRNAETYKVLDHYLNLFQPTHVGLILHWQETAQGFLRVGERIKSHNKGIKIIGGGFTAGYFGANLLEKCRMLDFVVKGDPEKPLEFLLNGAAPSDVPNLIYRDPAGTRSSEVSYFIDQETLSGISFSELTYLYDYELYLDAIERKLGFPVFIGRGCVHGCAYCGGSCAAFRLHSARVTPVERSIEAVVADLKRLKDFTRKIYLCYENDTDYIKSLFSAMKREQTLMKTFHLNYGAWQLPDEEFLESYRELFVSSGNIKPVLELSPEVFSDGGRKRVKNGSVYYSIGELKKNLDLINDHLGDSINVSIFFSRYHDTAVTYADMKKEIQGIFRLTHNLLCENLTNAKVFYDHLSTDVASRYWENYVKQPKDFDTLIAAVKKGGELGFPMDNLCAYFPETLSKEEISRCELLVSVLKTLERYCREMFHIMFKCLDDQMIDIIEDIILESYSKRHKEVFASFDHDELLRALKQRIAGYPSLHEKIPFVEDLIDLNIKKFRVQQSRYGRESSNHAEILKLDYELISVHEHDYLDLQLFLKRLDNEGAGNLRPEKTVHIFLADEILTMPCATFDSTLKEFEKGITVSEYHELMQKKGIFTPSYHKTLISKLLLNKVLV